jgi:uncharacterized membrane protein (DUF485 family)
VSQEKARALLGSSELRRLIGRRWLVSMALTVVLFVVYYGYILLVALEKPFMARRLGEGVTTIGIPIGVAVILLSWVLTAIYVAWANTRYDAEVRRLRSEIH